MDSAVPSSCTSARSSAYSEDSGSASHSGNIASHMASVQHALDQSRSWSSQELHGPAGDQYMAWVPWERAAGDVDGSGLCTRGGSTSSRAEAPSLVQDDAAILAQQQAQMQFLLQQLAFRVPIVPSSSGPAWSTDAAREVSYQDIVQRSLPGATRASASAAQPHTSVSAPLSAGDVQAAGECVDAEEATASEKDGDPDVEVDYELAVEAASPPVYTERNVQDFEQVQAGEVEAASWNSSTRRAVLQCRYGLLDRGGIVVALSEHGDDDAAEKQSDAAGEAEDVVPVSTGFGHSNHLGGAAPRSPCTGGSDIVVMERVVAENPQMVDGLLSGEVATLEVEDDAASMAMGTGSPGGSFRWSALGSPSGARRCRSVSVSFVPEDRAPVAPAVQNAPSPETARQVSHTAARTAEEPQQGQRHQRRQPPEDDRHHELERQRDVALAAPVRAPPADTRSADALLRQMRSYCGYGNQDVLDRWAEKHLSIKPQRRAPPPQVTFRADPTPEELDARENRRKERLTRHLKEKAKFASKSMKCIWEPIETETCERQRITRSLSHDSGSTAASTSAMPQSPHDGAAVAATPLRQTRLSPSPRDAVGLEVTPPRKARSSSQRCAESDPRRSEPLALPPSPGAEVHVSMTVAEAARWPSEEELCHRLPMMHSPSLPPIDERATSSLLAVQTAASPAEAVGLEVTPPRKARSSSRRRAESEPQCSERPEPPAVAPSPRVEGLASRPVAEPARWSSEEEFCHRMSTVRSQSVPPIGERTKALLPAATTVASPAGSRVDPGCCLPSLTSKPPRRRSASSASSGAHQSRNVDKITVCRSLPLLECSRDSGAKQLDQVRAMAAQYGGSFKVATLAQQRFERRRVYLSMRCASLPPLAKRGARNEKSSSEVRAT